MKSIRKKEASIEQQLTKAREIIEEYIKLCHEQMEFIDKLTDEIYKLREAYDKMSGKKDHEKVGPRKVERYTNCTVEVTTDEVSGDVSIGWWKNEEAPPVKILKNEENHNDICDSGEDSVVETKEGN